MSTAEMERYWMWLCSCPKLYRNTILALTDYFGSPKAVYEADTRQLLAWKKLGNDEMTAWVNELTVYKETTGTAQAEELLEQRGLQFVIFWRREETFFKLTECSLFPDLPAVQ